jgi:hypothetical protein
MVNRHVALVERPVACSGRGQYIALVHYGSKSGDLFHKVFKYSYKDPRTLKDESTVLQDITRAIPAQYRDFIVAISVVKKCLHPKSDEVAKRDRKVHYERVFSWVVKHDHSTEKSFDQDAAHRLQTMLAGGRVQNVSLPYTRHELQEMPITQTLMTNYWMNAHARVGMRGVERIVEARELSTTPN